MSDRQPLDEDLTRLFEGARTDLPSEAFVEQLERRLARARRMRLGTQVVLLAVLAAAAALMTPYVARGSLTVMDYAARWLPDVALALSSPAGWAASLILGAWVLKRAHVFER
jgi:hypothetical protein